MKTDFLQLAGASTSGAILAVLFFAGLYATVAAVPRVRRKGLLLFSSFAGRLGVVLAGFLFIGNGSFPRMIAALAGFFITRQVLIAILGCRAKPQERKPI